jgi:hypothetical protein
MSGLRRATAGAAARRRPTRDVATRGDVVSVVATQVRSPPSQVETDERAAIKHPQQRDKFMSPPPIVR